MSYVPFYQKFQPSHYTLFLDVNRKKKLITGKTIVTGYTAETEIALHQKYLKVEEVLFKGEPLNFVTDDQDESLRIALPETGEITLEITYTAPLTDTMMGIYPSYYMLNGEKKQLVGTQFESTAARQAFPCIDEPEAKATFDLAISFDEEKGETILSNMPEIKVENGYHYFATTVKMSTYLIAFVFGDLQKKTTTTKNGVEVGVFSTKAHELKELDFALDIAKRSIEFYEEFYQTPYPLPHSWQVALPDFSAGAMENWGLITYREVYLLLDKNNTPLRTKQVVATVIAHEVAHQWFGDLVTMKWWDDLWLNESFANMMEYVAVDALEPDWKVWELFQTSDVPAALQRDATDGVQSVHVAVNDPGEIDTLFDGAIVYAKGARLLVMVRALIGDKALQKGLKNYFTKFQYKNAVGADLWDALGNASGLPIGDMMTSWLEQPGYPVVEAKVVDGKLTLSQKQFFIGEGEDKNRQWQIPTNSNYQNIPPLMREKTLVLGEYQTLRQENGLPFRLNLGNNAHYIVHYDEELLTDILQESDELDAISKLQLLQDQRLLAEGNVITYAKIIPLLKEFAQSQESLVIDAVYQGADALKKFVQTDSYEEKNLKKLFATLSYKQINRLNILPVKGENIDNQLVRPLVINAGLYGENEQLSKDLHELYLEKKENLLALPSDIAAFVFLNEMKNYPTEESFTYLLQNYEHTTDTSLKQALGKSIVFVNNEQLLDRLVDNLKNAEIIKPQDLRQWFAGLLSNPKSEQKAWDWLRNNWDWLEKTVGGDMEFSTYILVLSRRFKTKERLEEFEKFFNPMINQPALTREITMSKRVIESRIKLIEAQEKAVKEALR